MLSSSGKNIYLLLGKMWWELGILELRHPGRDYEVCITLLLFPEYSFS